MRFMMKVLLDTPKANELARNGEMGSTLKAIIEDARPEAAYFVAEEGRRSAVLIVNFDEPSDMPRYAEPWFLAFDATVTVQPAMTPADLQGAAGGIEAAVRSFG